MLLHLIRQYHARGTNGVIRLNNKHICYTIELPWKANQRNVSCIPEGKYDLKLRYSIRFKWHLHLINVSNRELILFHPANHALKELKGCIAPVTALTAPGRGTESLVAFQQLKQVAYSILKERKKISMIIKS